MDNIDQIEYSKEAIEVKASFYGKDFSVFVEGEDDIIFWRSLFSLAGYDNVHFEDVGGYTELTPYFNVITDEGANILIACDTDHKNLIGFDFVNDKIIRTYGYSIENHLYSIQRLYQLIHKFSPKSSLTKDDIKNWRMKFSSDSTKLLIYSVANMKFSKGIEIFGDKCVRFLKDKSAFEISEQKIDDFIAGIDTHFTTREKNAAKKIVEESTVCRWYLIKGHFLTNGVLNFLSNTIESETNKKPHISLKTLYALCVDCEELKDLNFKEFKEMNKSIKKGIKSIE